MIEIIIYYQAALLELQHAKKNSNSTEKKELAESIIEYIDKGLLLGAPLPSMPDLLTTIASNINDYYSCKETAKSLQALLD